MKLINAFKARFFAMSLKARIVWVFMLLAFLFVVIQILSAFFDDSEAVAARELGVNISSSANAALRTGKQTDDIVGVSSDPLLKSAREMEDSRSGNEFNKSGVATSNVNLAAWQMKDTNVQPNRNQSNLADSDDIVKSARSDRLPSDFSMPSAFKGTVAATSQSVVASSIVPAETFQEPENSTMDRPQMKLTTEERLAKVKLLTTKLIGSSVDSNMSRSAQSSYVTNVEQYLYETTGLTPQSVRNAEYTAKINQLMTLAQNSDIPDATTVMSGDSLPTGRGLLPGDVIPCALSFAINSDVSSMSSCEVVAGPLKGAVVQLNVVKLEEYVQLDANGITFGNNFGEGFSAVAISLAEMGSTGIRSDIDRHILARWSSLIFAGALDGIWELYKAPRQSVTVTEGGGIVQQTLDPTDRQLIVAALSRPASIISQNATEYFNRPNTIYVHRGELVGLYVRQPFNASWMPDVSNSANQVKF